MNSEDQGNARPLQERHRNKRFPLRIGATAAVVSVGDGFVINGPSAPAKDPQPALPDPQAEGNRNA